jgi:hypothetical protein
MACDRLIAIAAGSLVLFTCAEVAGQTKGPILLPFVHQMAIIRLTDGRLMGNFLRTRGGVSEAAARYSKDNGVAWSEPETLFKLRKEGGSWAGPMALLDQHAEVHLFFLKWEDAKSDESRDGTLHGYLGGYGGKRLDIWHAKSMGARKEWQPPARIWKGYTGALNSVAQMTNGRIVFPFAQFMPPRAFGGGGNDLAAFTFMGPFQSTAVFSDDRGETWRLSPSSLSAEVPSIVHGYGADEPVVLQLKDGRVWMLMRTQRGRLYESFSADGAAWSRARPTRFIASDSPAGLVRVDDGRIVLFWNCCQRFPYAFGGRHVLHAAISADEGKTWRGFREVARDPKRNEPPPADIDFGTAYPFPTAANAGRVIYYTGQGEGRVLLTLLDPQWLLEKTQRADFSVAQDAWSVFGTKGVEFAAHPEKGTAKILRVRKTHGDWPACAVWNFPAGLRGLLRVKLMSNPGFQGALIGITDHFSTPFDMEDRFSNLFNLDIASDGRILEESGGAQPALSPGRWNDLTLAWDCGKRNCRVVLDGHDIRTLPLLRETLGACYLRLRSTAEQTDNAGFLVESVEAEVQ